MLIELPWGARVRADQVAAVEAMDGPTGYEARCGVVVVTLVGGKELRSVSGDKPTYNTLVGAKTAVANIARKVNETLAGKRSESVTVD